MVMEAFSNTRSAYQFEKLRHEERVVEGFPFMTCWGEGARRHQSFVKGATPQDGEELRQGKQSISHQFHTICWPERVSI